MPIPNKCDFFISYNAHDRKRAEWIAWTLEEAGYSTIIQAWDFRPGNNFILAMQKGLIAAERVIIVLSSHFLEALYTQPEWAALFADGPDGLKAKVVPVRVGKCEPKGLLRGLVYIDILGKNETESKGDLLAGVKEGRQKPAIAPEFCVEMESPAPVGPCSEEKRTQYKLVLTGTIDSIDRPTIEAIIEHVRKFAKDTSITLVETRAGSIVIVLDGTREGYDRFHKLFEEGSVRHIEGFRIEEINESDPDSLSVSEAFSLARRKLYAYAKKHVQSHEEAEDLMLDAVSYVLGRHPHAPSLKLEDFVASARTFMRWSILAQSRLAHHRGGPMITLGFHDVRKSEAEVEIDPVDLERLGILFSDFEKHDPRSGGILRMFYFEEAPAAAIAAAMGLSIKGIDSAKQRALIGFRQYLRLHGIETSPLGFQKGNKRDDNS